MQHQVSPGGALGKCAAYSADRAPTDPVCPAQKKRLSPWRRVTSAVRPVVIYLSGFYPHGCFLASHYIILSNDSHRVCSQFSFIFHDAVPNIKSTCYAVFISELFLFSTCHLPIKNRFPICFTHINEWPQNEFLTIGNLPLTFLRFKKLCRVSHLNYN